MKTLHTDWREEGLWKDVLKAHNSTCLSMRQDILLVEFWKKHPTLTLSDFEKEFRANNINMYLFAKDTRTNTGGNEIFSCNPATSKQMPFYVIKSCDIENAKLTYPEHFFDKELNLKKLEKTGYRFMREKPEHSLEFFRKVAVDSPGSEFIITEALAAFSFLIKATNDDISLFVTNNITILISEETKKKIAIYLKWTNLPKLVNYYLETHGWLDK